MLNFYTRVLKFPKVEHPDFILCFTVLQPLLTLRVLKFLFTGKFEHPDTFLTIYVIFPFYISIKQTVKIEFIAIT